MTMCSQVQINVGQKALGTRLVTPTQHYAGTLLQKRLQTPICELIRSS